MKYVSIISLTFLSVSLYGEHTQPRIITPQTASEVMTHADAAIAHEDYVAAQSLLLDLASQPLKDIQLLFKLSLSLIKLGAFKEGVTLLERILQNNPNNTTVLYNCGYALKSGGFIDEALPYYQKVLGLEPENDGAHLALGFAYLNKGDFAHGWPQHERYLKKHGKYAPELRALLNNQTLAGKRILLIPEGGLGDTINFIQCAQLLRNLGASVIASVQKPLFKLLQSCDCVDEVIAGVPAGLQYDARVTYMSLPAALYLDEATMPQRTPYLYADPTLIEFWQTKLSEKESVLIPSCSNTTEFSLDSSEFLHKNGLDNPSIHPTAPSASSGTQSRRQMAMAGTQGDRERMSHNQKQNSLLLCNSHNITTEDERTCHALAPKVQKRIGLCWQADAYHDESRMPVARRSIPLALLAQLAEIPGITLYSLQTQEHNAACYAPDIAGNIHTFDYPIDTEHGPFMDTAALIMNMDLVISVDTATAHLAAALGKPTWLLLPYSTDWRWLTGRTDSPWHPTVRIFKQPAPFDWQSVIDEMTKELVR